MSEERLQQLEKTIKSVLLDPHYTSSRKIEYIEPLDKEIEMIKKYFPAKEIEPPKPAPMSVTEFMGRMRTNQDLRD